jgi:hypothetical protein
MEKYSIPRYTAEASLTASRTKWAAQARSKSRADEQCVVPQGCWSNPWTGETCCCYFGACWCQRHLIRALA